MPPPIIFLPATDPSDETYGRIPSHLPACPNQTLHAIAFPTVVWYNPAVRAEAAAQIRALNLPPAILVGFSKSGLGAFHLAYELPDRIAATVIFDAPVARETCPPWGTAPFYENDVAWHRDLPMRTIDVFERSVAKTHKLILISGTSFHDEMRRFAEALGKTTVNHLFFPRPTMRHHWQSGWIEEGLGAVLKAT